MDLSSLRANVRATVLPVLGSYDHGLEKGEAVKIIFAGLFGQTRSTLLNDNVKITNIGTTVVGSETFYWFEYQLTQDPGSASGDFAPGWYGRLWRTDYFVVENNILELAIRNSPSTYNHPSANFLYVGLSGPQFRILQFLGRGNIIRNVNDQPDPNANTPNYYGFAYAFEIQGVGGTQGVEQCLVQKNIVRLDTDDIAGPLGSIQY